jgi:hypothetical protein
LENRLEGSADASASKPFIVDEDALNGSNVAWLVATALHTLTLENVEKLDEAQRDSAGPQTSLSPVLLPEQESAPDLVAGAGATVFARDFQSRPRSLGGHADGGDWPAGIGDDSSKPLKISFRSPNPALWW